MWPKIAKKSYFFKLQKANKTKKIGTTIWGKEKEKKGRLKKPPALQNIWLSQIANSSIQAG